MKTQGVGMNDWRGLEEFAQVVERGSLTKAAYSMGLSKSYISKTISDLEARLGVQLLFRSTRCISMTPAGELFYERCREMRRIYQEAEQELCTFQQSPSGRLRIGLCDVYGVTFMASIVAEFAERHPDVSLEVFAYLDPKELLAGEYDVVIRYGTLPDSEMKISRMGYLSYGLAASADYVAAHGWPSSPDDLQNHRCLCDASGSFYFSAEDGRVQRVKVKGNWTSNSAIALAIAARHGLGIAQVPISTILDPLADGSMVVLDEEWAYFDQEVWVCFPPGIQSAATRAFIDYLTGRFAKSRLTVQSAQSIRELYLLRGQGGGK